MTLDPHRVYIEFLASRHPSEQKALKVLDALALPHPYPGSFQRIRRLIVERAPTKIRLFLEGRSSLDSLDILWEWVLSQRFGVFWGQEPIFKLHQHPDQMVFDRAWAVLRMEPMRDTVDAVLLQQWAIRHSFDLGKLNDITGLRFGDTMDEAAFEMYRALFFNPSRVAKANWLYYLDGCQPLRKEMLLLAMGHRDEKRFRHEIGAPPRFQYTELLTDVMARAYYRFKEADGEANPDARQLRFFAKMLMEAGDRREKWGQQDMADMRRDLQLGFNFLEADFPSLEDVESGLLDEALGFGDEPG